MKKFFRIDADGYKFEWNDLRALLQIVNVMLIVFAGFNVGAIFGLVIGGLGLLKDLTIDRHINGIVLHLAGIALNVYILCMQTIQTDWSFFIAEFRLGGPSGETERRRKSVSRLVPSGRSENVFIK